MQSPKPKYHYLWMCNRIINSTANKCAGFLYSSVGKESACNAGDPSLIPQSGRSPGDPLQYSWAEKIPWRRDMLPTPVFLGFPCGSAGKESTSNVGDLSSVPGLGWSPEGKGYPLQYSCLENPMDRTAYSPWGGNSQTWLSKWSEVAQSCPTLCDPMDCSLPGSSLGLWDFPARKLEWLAISFSMTEQAHMLLIMD